MNAGGRSEARLRAIQGALSTIDPDRRPSVERLAAEMSVLYRNCYLKAAAGKASPREAIKAHCLECVGWERSESTLCTGTACPLYAYRPFQGGA